MTNTFFSTKLQTHKNLQSPNFNFSCVVNVCTVSWRCLTAHLNAGVAPLICKVLRFVFRIPQCKSPSKMYDLPSRKYATPKCDF